jgi:UDP-N-acetylmuramyl tripeptide synthase
MTMQIEVTITDDDAKEAMKLIQEYLYKGGEGLNYEALERVLQALGEADRIIIQQEGAETWKSQSS